MKMFTLTDFTEDILTQIVDQLSDNSKKMLLSICREFRKLLSQWKFRDSVSWRHLLVCPFPENHSNVSIAARVEFPFPNLNHVTSLTFSDCDRAVFDLRLMTNLRDATLVYSSSWTGRYENNIVLPDCVEHLVFPAIRFKMIPQFARVGRKMIVTTYSSTGHPRLPSSWADRYVPRGLKYITALYVDDSTKTISVPHEEETFSLTFV